jgi:signal transduction histidine kinase
VKRLGLRAKVTATFAAGALAISAATAILTYDLTRGTLLASRQRSAIRLAYFDAGVVQAGLSGSDPDVIALLRSLDTGATRHDLVFWGGSWYSRTADTGFTAAIPSDLQRLVADGQTAVQRVRVATGPAFVIGIPLPGGADFYVIDSLTELDQTLRTLSLILTLVAAGTTAAGAAVGAYSSRRTLRPLGEVATAARNIAAGDLRARLDPSTEPDLQPLTDAFNDMVDQLGERIARDRRFAADVSHELRSPLQTLGTATSVLYRRRAQFDDRAATAITLLHDEITRFQTLVTDLLELARADQVADREGVAVADLARQVCRDRNLPADLVTVAADTPVTWPVERRRLEQVLVNLLDNAVHHGGGPAGVSLAVRCGDRDAPGWGTIDVDDTGPGVAPDQRQAIFHRFVRGAGSGARGDSDGTGLGLALVAQHVAAHGGRVEVLDRPGGGARFHVELPLEPACAG